MRRRSAWLARGALGACLLLAACNGAERTEASFGQPDYSYLPKLRLNVGTITIEDHAAAGADPGGLDQEAPVPPAQALRQMAHDRLVAAGNSGTGLFTIDQATITGGGGVLDGHLSAHLDILTANGGHAGYAEAHVSRQLVPGPATSDGGTRAELYDLTTQMMQDMNVELEYQVRRSLRDWLVDASGAPVAGSVEQQTLAPPGAPPGTPLGTPLGADALPAGAPPIGAPPAEVPPAASPDGGRVGIAPVGIAPAGTAPVGTTPVGATPFSATPPDPAAAPIPLAPDVPAAGAPPGGGSGDSGVDPGPATPPPPPPAPLRSPPPGFLQPPPSAGGGSGSP